MVVLAGIRARKTIADQCGHIRTGEQGDLAGRRAEGMKETKGQNAQRGKEPDSRLATFYTV